MDGEFLPPGLMEAMYRDMLGLPPDTRTPAEKERDAVAWAEGTKRIRLEVVNGHAQALAAAWGLRRAVIELHGPKFYSETDRHPRCAGCEYDGYEAEAPAFPCSTYELARDFPSP